MCGGVGTNKKCCLSAPGQPHPLVRCEEHPFCTQCFMKVMKHEKWKIQHSDQTQNISFQLSLSALVITRLMAQHRTQNENWLMLNRNNHVTQQRRQRSIWLAQSLVDATRMPHSALLPQVGLAPRFPTGSLSASEPHP